ncbi:MAG: TetR/AcrR family transcriptional regulator [Candidatus Acidiferrales bacterium]
MTARPNLLSGENLFPAPLQKRSLAKRARLKAAGLARFGEKGYEGTSVGDISRHAQLAVGTFYQHFRSKRQLLLILMDDLLEGLSRLDLRTKAVADVRSALREMLARAFSTDLHYLGAYRAWQEAILTDPDLARKQKFICTWTTGRITSVFRRLQQLPGARPDVDIPGLARAMDSFFWNLLGQAARLSKKELNQWIDAATHLIYHAIFTDVPRRG